jgi:hypothetical protein
LQTTRAIRLGAYGSHLYPAPIGLLADVELALRAELRTQSAALAVLLEYRDLELAI